MIDTVLLVIQLTSLSIALHMLLRMQKKIDNIIKELRTVK